MFSNPDERAGEPVPTAAAPGHETWMAAVPALPRDPDEALIADARAQLTPAQMVEQKLVTLLQGKLIPVSHLRVASYPGVRSRGGPTFTS
jgi:hypothetical protein